MFEELKNWGRWGPDDQRGALNHLTDARRVAAVGLVRTGESVSLSHDLATEPQPEHPHPVQHHMLASGDARDANGIPGYEAARDHLALDVHGLLTTHVDALSHMFVRGEMYGGRPASDVRSDGARDQHRAVHGRRGRSAAACSSTCPGPSARPTSASGQVVTVEDLEVAESRPGRDRRDRATSCSWPGGARPARRPPGGSTASPASTPSACRGCRSARWRCSGATGSPTRCRSWARRSGPSRSTRSGSRPWGSTSSTTCALAALAERCAASGRWEFLFTMGPLRIAKGTGCPVNPVAVL